jgi:hypothetical protein
LYASQIYGITASQLDKYAKKIFTDNFQALTLSIKAAVLDYWAKLDKAGNERPVQGCLVTRWQTPL